MPGRDRWSEILSCNTCETNGQAEFSQAASVEYSEGNHEITVERVSDGFKAVMVEYGSRFFCAICERPMEPRAP